VGPTLRIGSRPSRFRPTVAGLWSLACALGRPTVGPRGVADDRRTAALTAYGLLQYRGRWERLEREWQCEKAVSQPRRVQSLG
jgi:hypothetical protein